MKLLFDQNLSHRLTRLLAAIYPDCQHVRDVGLKAAPDSQVWVYAKDNGYTIVSKDADFHQRSFVFGAPPQVIWIRSGNGNCSTEAIEALLRDKQSMIAQFAADEAAAFLILP